MDINELLSLVKRIAKRHNLSEPFVVGGVPRDRIMAKSGKEINDVDLTTGDGDSTKLGELVAEALPTAKYRTYDDGHSSIDFRELKVDFSNNFNSPGIDEELERMGVKDITPMTKELYSRDFCINAIMEDLDLANVYDLTGEGISDIEAGIIKCPINPEISIGVDPRRILRAIKFSIKFGFDIEEGLKNAMLNHKNKIKDLPPNFVTGKMNEIVRIDDEKGIDMLIEYKLLPLVPLSKTISDMLIQKRQLVRAL